MENETNQPIDINATNVILNPQSTLRLRISNSKSNNQEQYVFELEIELVASKLLIGKNLIEQVSPLSLPPIAEFEI